MCLSWTEWLGKRCSSNKRSSLEFSKSVRLWWACKSFPSEIHSRVFSTLSGTVNMCFKFSIATAYWEWITCSSLTLFTLSHKLGSGIIASSISWSLNFKWNLSYNTNNWLNIWFFFTVNGYHSNLLVLIATVVIHSEHHLVDFEQPSLTLLQQMLFSG